jgi:Flp pilus assembly pilin Flp
LNVGCKSIIIIPNRTCFGRFAMRDFLASFIREQGGQDIVEYTMLMAFLVVCSAALLLLSGESVRYIWGATSNNLSAAHSAAS